MTVWAGASEFNGFSSHTFTNKSPVMTTEYLFLITHTGTTYLIIIFLAHEYHTHGHTSHAQITHRASSWNTNIVIPYMYIYAYTQKLFLWGLESVFHLCVHHIHNMTCTRNICGQPTPQHVPIVMLLFSNALQCGMGEALAPLCSTHGELAPPVGHKWLINYLCLR